MAIILTKLLPNVAQIILNILILYFNVGNEMKSQKYDKIVLFDSSSKLQDLADLENHKNLIITFDYESHVLLLKNNISHVISDNYLVSNEIAMIQENSYRFSKFSNEEKIHDLLVYEGIQLGGLFYIELYVFLLSFLKNFFEIKKITEKHTSMIFISSPHLTNLVKLFTNDVDQLNIKSKKLEFSYDYIKVNFKIKSLSINLKIPHRYYNFIKNISDRIIDMTLSHRFSETSKKRSLLVEFDTIKYSQLLLEKNADFLIYNRRRPTIWNFKSYKTIRKSRSSVVTNSSLKITEKKLKNNVSKADEMIKLLLKNDHFLSEFFCLDGNSFWNALKPYFIALCKKRFIDAIEEITAAEQLFKIFQIKSIIIWSESGFNELIMIQLGKKHCIPIVLLQHGLYYDTLKAKKSNIFQGVLPILSDKFAVWGKILESYALECGIPQNQIILVGNPSFDELFKNKHNDIGSEYVLLATQSPTDASVNDLTIDVIKKYESVIKKICEITTKLNKRLIIKLHPDPHELDITDLVHETNESIEVIKNGNIQDLLRKCELLITIDVSTTILEAQILEKPTVSISVKDYSVDEDNCSVFTSQSCIRTKIDNLENILGKILSDQNFKNTLIQNGNKYVNDYVYNQGTASKCLSNIRL